MQRSLTAMAVAAALVLGLAAPAGSQELGALELDAGEGAPGDVVGAQLVDPGVVPANCATTPEEVHARFFADSGIEVRNRWSDPGPIFQDYMARGPLIGFVVPDAWPAPPPIFLPGPPPEGVDPQVWAWGWRFGVLGAPPATESLEQDAARYLWMFFDFLTGDGVASGQAMETYLPSTFILTFADIGTQQPIGVTGNFDPETGAGALTVPDVEPGFIAAAATCVEPEITDASFEAALAAGVEVLETNDIALGTRPNPVAGADLFAEMVEAMLTEVMQPQAGPWVALFCVTAADGECPDDVPPTDPPGLNGPIPPAPGQEPPSAPPAPAVTGEPGFTG